MTQEQTSEFIMPSDPKAKEAIKSIVKEISNVKLRMEAERDYIKEAVAELSENHDIPKKIITKLANAYHKQEMTKMTAEAEDLDCLYETIFGTNDQD